MKISVVLPVCAPTPFLRAMTEFCIRALRENAVDDFELVVVEAGEPFFDPSGVNHDASLGVDRYVHFAEKIGVTKEINAGFDAAAGEYVVFAGNDVIALEGWDMAIMEPFEKYADCGVACLAALEPGYFIGPSKPLPLIVEGMYAPFMMFRKGWRFDEEFVAYCDSDLVMRMYAAGLRAYRNNRVQVHHLNGITRARVQADGGAGEIAEGEKLFYERWGDSPLWMFGMIRSGAIVYGREHEAWLRPIQLHPIKEKQA